MSSTYPPIALVDCNNFFVSCERLFRPDLAEQPIIVLSSNDGCVVSRSNEAKALGFKMGEPYFQVREKCHLHNVAVFSSNFALYRDISRRVMYTLRRFSDNVEVYSIDEAFLSLEGMHALQCAELRGRDAELCGTNPPASEGAGRADVDTKKREAELSSNSHQSWAERWGREVQETILREVGIPVSVGVAPTKTLAKVATHLVKEANKKRTLSKRTSCDDSSRMYVFSERGEVSHGVGDTSQADVLQADVLHADTLHADVLHTASNVLVLLDARTQRQALESTPVEEVWGVGFRLAPMLRATGITTAADLVAQPEHWLLKHMSVRGLRTALELRGVRCFCVGGSVPLRKSLLHSQSFAAPLTAYPRIASAVAYHARKVAEILRAEGALAREMTVCMRATRHYAGAPIATHGTLVLPMHTSDTLTLVHTAVRLCASMYRPGVPYGKAGFMVRDIIHEESQPARTLFDDMPSGRAPLMAALDAIRHRYGDVIRVGVEANPRVWEARHALLSPAYTTDWGAVCRIGV